MQYPASRVSSYYTRAVTLDALRKLFLILASLLIHEVAVRHKAKLEAMTWALRIWGLASAALAIIVLFPSPQSWPPAQAIRSSPSDFSHLVHASVLDFGAPFHPNGDKLSMMPVFRVARTFRNGKNCVSNTGNTSELQFVCDPLSVHIAMTLDGAYLRGSIAAVLSILQHASCPENVVFHFLVSDADEEFRSLIQTTFPCLKFKIYYFDVSLVKDRISSSIRQALEQPLNYARNYLADILEVCVRRVIYLDSDLVVVDDIAKLWGTSLGSKPLGAPEYCHANFSKYFTTSFWSNKTLAMAFETRTPCYFNTGVMIMDLVKWRQNKYSKKIEQWMEIQKESRIYELGSLPPFLLVFAGSIEPVEHRWNQHGLGGDNVKGSCRPLHPGPVSLLHWSGEGKPWLRLDSRRPCPLDSLWAPYDLYLSPSHFDS
eukprot:c19971_g2_i1 orf=1123-2409(+)